jgi:hypothetical protein
MRVLVNVYASSVKWCVSSMQQVQQSCFYYACALQQRLMMTTAQCTLIYA